MLNKKVLLGVLVAGAMALPLTASAGVVQGTCVTCHTMHNSQNRADVGGANPQGTLLQAGGCEGCHAGGSNNAQGIDPNQFNAPQVDDASAPNLAGWFTLTGVTNTHNITEDLTGMVPDSNMTLAPGGLVANTTCVGCHTMSSGGHHGQGGSTYRMLFTTATSDQVEDSTYGNTQTANTVTTADTTYDSDEMNQVCANCHGDFHGGTDQYDTANSTWLRHPTDLSLAQAYQSNYDYAGNYALITSDVERSAVPLGTGDSVVHAGRADGTDNLMCITCHFSHGSNQPDLLRFAYDASNNVAGNASGSYVQSVGCESCHTYRTALGQDGM